MGFGLSRVPEEERSEIEQVLERAASQRKLFRHRYRITTETGALHHVEITGTFSAATGTLRMVGVLRDVSDEVGKTQAESRLQAQASVAHAQSRLLSRVSHELRTPLNHILGFAQVMALDATPLPPRQLGWVQEIEKAARRLLSMVEDVLRITVVSDERIVFMSHDVDLQEAVQVALVANQGHFDARRITALRTVNDDAFMARADPERLGELLLRLMGHAAEAASPGTSLRISVLRTGGRLVLRIVVPGWQTTVNDDHTLLTQGSQPLGFGLALVEVLTNRMNGRLDVTSQADGGTSVSLDLPAARP